MQTPTQAGRTGGRERLYLLAECAFASLLALALFAHAYVGFFTRYMADDYCSAGTLRTAGFLETQRHFYLVWSGRFSFTLSVSLFELLGTGVVPFLPAAALLCWLAATTWAVYELLSTSLGRRPLLHSFFLAELLVYATVGDNRGGVYEALYWQTGVLTYVAPLVLLTALAGAFARALRLGKNPFGGRLFPAVVFAAAFFNGGFSETSGLLQAGAFLAAFAAAAFLPGAAPRRRLLLPPLSAGLLGSLLALAVVALAPGNSAREAALPAHSGLLTVVARALSNAFAHAFSEHNVPGTAALRWAAPLLPAALSFRRARRDGAAGGDSKLWPRLLAPAAAGAFLSLCCFLPASYALSGAPPPRALVVPQFVLVCTLAALGWAGGRAAARYFPRGAMPRPALELTLAALALLLTLPFIQATRRTFSQAGKARALARLWDRHDAEIRARVARGERRLTVPVAYNIGGTDLMKRDPGWYVNHCVAVFYGAESVTAVPEEEGFRIVAGE